TEQPVGQVPAERKRLIQVDAGGDRRECAVTADAVEQQAADKRVRAGLGGGDRVVDAAGELVEFVGVGEQVPAGAGQGAQPFAQLCVGVLVPRAGAGQGRSDAEIGGGAQQRVPMARVHLFGEVECDQE